MYRRSFSMVVFVIQTFSMFYVHEKKMYVTLPWRATVIHDYQ